MPVFSISPRGARQRQRSYLVTAETPHEARSAVARSIPGLAGAINEGLYDCSAMLAPAPPRGVIVGPQGSFFAVVDGEVPAPPRPARLLDPETVHFLRNFVRGASDAARFERWLYDEDNAEAAFGADLYMALISTDYQDRDALFLAQRQLGEFMERWYPPNCICEARDSTNFVLGMGSDEADYAFDTIKTVAFCPEPRGWLSLGRCSVCGTHWFVGTDSVVHDDYEFLEADSTTVGIVLRRNLWPPTVLDHVGKRMDRDFR